MRALIDIRWTAQWSGLGTRDGLRRLFAAPRRSAATALVLATMAGVAMGARAYAAPPTSNEIRIGVTAPYTGPASAYGVIAKVMEATCKLVEEDQVLFTMATIGTNTNAAIQPYLNSKKVPQLFVLSGAAAWDQPQEFPWTMGFLPTYIAEAQIYAQYLLENHPRSRIAVLYQEDGMGKEYLKGLKDGLSGKMAIVG